MTEEKFIEKTIKTLEKYLQEQMWLYTEPPLGKEECKLFLKVLKQDIKEKERIIKELENEVKYWRNVSFCQDICDEKARSYQHAIEIVKGVYNYGK